MNKSPLNPDNFSDFQIPETFLEQLYDFTGGEEGNSGFFLSYVDSKGNPMVYCRASSPIIEMGLRKAMERYLMEIEEGEVPFDSSEQ
jgi:hypothetical protein